MLGNKIIYVLAIPAAVGSCSLTNPYAEADIGIKNVSDIKSCVVNQVMLSPDGKRAVMWFENMEPLEPTNLNIPDGFTVYRREQDDRDIKFEVVTAGRKLTPIRWNAAGDKLYFRYGADGLAARDFKRNEIAGPTRLAGTWRQVRIRSLQHGNLSFLEDDGVSARLKKLQKSGNILRQFATVDQTPRFFGVKDTAGYPIVGEAAPADRGEFPSSVFVRDPLLLRDGAGREVLYYVGRQPDGHGTASGAAMVPYNRPLIDLATGKAVGTFGLTQVVLSRGEQAGRSIDFERADWLKGSLIQSVSVSGASVAILFRDAADTLKLALTSDDDTQIVTMCTRSKQPPGLEALRSSDKSLGQENSRQAPSFQVSYVDFPSRPSFGTLFTSARRPRELVVYFHGGPTSSLWGVGVPAVVEELATSSRDVLAVEYAGSIGGGMQLSLSLAREGPKAIEEDVAAVSDWIKREGYSKISIVAESFGAAPGLHAINRYPQVYESAYFIVPLLRLREPAEWVSDTQFHRIPASSQLQYEHTAFGGPAGRETFRNWLDHQRELYTPRATDRFYFGSTDKISQESDIKYKISDYPVTLTLRGGHAISGRKEVWDSIRAAIGSAGDTR